MKKVLFLVTAATVIASLSDQFAERFGNNVADPSHPDLDGRPMIVTIPEDEAQHLEQCGRGRILADQDAAKKVTADYADRAAKAARAAKDTAKDAAKGADA